METPLSYNFVAPSRIIFGWGRRREVGLWGRTLGRRALLVCGRSAHRAEAAMKEMFAALEAEGVEAVSLATLSREPEVDDVDGVAEQVRGCKAGEGDFLLAVGGGAVIDLAKAAAAMATNSESTTVKDYLENVGRGLKITRPPLPVLAMPTTAGTGAEATKNAVISCSDPPSKRSLRDDRLMPRIALIDPELTATVPPKVTAASGMDAITQLIESYVSRRWQPIPRALAIQGLRMAVPAIVEAVENGASRPAREAMSHAALLSGMALANSGLGMAHGVAAALGGLCHVPHGAACALMLPATIRANLAVCEEEFAFLCVSAFSHPPGTRSAAAAAFPEEIEKLCQRVGVPRRLRQLGVTAEQIPQIVKGSGGSSMSGNPRELSDAELTAILEGLL